jgi:hypothetical protein
MSMDLTACPKELMEKINRETFHIYDPLKLQPNEHFSSNIPTFVVVSGLAMLMYETNERVLKSKNSNGPLLHVNENKFIFRCNAREILNMFHNFEKKMQRMTMMNW